MATSYVIVCGGVLSGVGKGIVSASVGKILQEYGYTVAPIKIDPYINIDAGTMRPTEHGEVWVTDDGGEIDQDLGNYERFLGLDIPKRHNITTGQVYQAIIERERRGEYLGKTVEFIPHVPQEVIRRLKEASEGYDVAIIEIGGTVGDFENIPFLFAAKSLERDLGREHVITMLVSYLPVPNNLGEAKTKPTQQAIKHLNECGIFPDFIFCRSKQPLDEVRRKKIETYANINSKYIISAPDVDTIYRVPLLFEEEEVGKKILERLGLPPRMVPQWNGWQRLIDVLANGPLVKIGIVGKYIDSGSFTLEDSYISVKHAISHAAAHVGVRPDIIWIDAKRFEQNPQAVQELEHLDAVIVPGGFGSGGVEGKILAIKACRERNIPFLGLCYGLQLAVVEFARHIANFPRAHTTEVDPSTGCPVVTILESQRSILQEHKMGGSMRLGAYAAELVPNSVVARLYERTGRLALDQARLRRMLDATNQQFRVGVLAQEHPSIVERHRHRYEVNPEFVPNLIDAGLGISGWYHPTTNTSLVEFIELSHHPYFVATQSHPEFKSRPLDPAPLFVGLLEAASVRSDRQPTMVQSPLPTHEPPVIQSDDTDE